MASTRSIVFTFVVAVAMLGIPTGEAQQGEIPGIEGSVGCSLNGKTDTNGLPAPPFPNALTALQCGNNVVSRTTTNAAGEFSFVSNPIQYPASYLVDNCSLAVKTPLSTCNSNLPSKGGLVSALVKNNVQFKVQCVGFTYNPALNINN